MNWGPLLLPAALAAGAVFGLTLTWVIVRASRRAGIDWSGLFADHATRQASHTKLWGNVANAVVLGLTIRVCWNATPEQVVMVFATVLGLIGGSQVASRIITAKYGGAATPAPGTTTTETKLEEKRTTVAPVPESATNIKPGGSDAPKA